MHKIICCQISTNLIYGNSKKDNISIMDKYYNQLYKNVNGYYKSKHYWEIPNWVSIINNNVRTGFHVVKTINSTVNYLKRNTNKIVLFSVLDINKDIIKTIISNCPDNTFYIGGYINKTYFDGLKNAIWFNSLKEIITNLEIPFKSGHNNNHFKNNKTIPRLTLSTGCLYNCDFCSIEHKLIEYDNDKINEQINSFKGLKFKLIYINDKTFGQCPNHLQIKEIYHKIKAFNNNFEGFIIQTTAIDILNISIKDIEEMHIKYIEIGVESFNDKILKPLHKPHTTEIIEKAFNYIGNIKTVKLIPNIIIGIPTENDKTYENTKQFLIKYDSVISHFNIYCLALYENTKLSIDLKHNDENDINENTLEKSFNKNNNSHKEFYNYIFNYGIEKVNKKDGE